MKIFFFFFLLQRLFQCYSALPSASYVVSQAVILRTLVETLALTSVPDNAPFVPYTSTLPSMGHNRDTAIAGWLLESDNKTLELLLTVPFIPGGEFDNFSLFERRPKNSWVQPLVHHPEVAAQDAAVSLFGALFPQLSQQQQETVVDSASKAVKAIKPTSPRRQPANVNIVAAILSSLRTVMGSGKQKTGTVHKGKVVTIIQELLQVKEKSCRKKKISFFYLFSRRRSSPPTAACVALRPTRLVALRLLSVGHLSSR